MGPLNLFLSLGYRADVGLLSLRRVVFPKTLAEGGQRVQIKKQGVNKKNQRDWAMANEISLMHFKNASRMFWRFLHMPILML